jgi:Uma2 family endonuclease
VYSCSELLITSLKLHWADRSGYFAGGNMDVHYDPSNKRCLRGLDFFLVLDVEDRERKRWVVWQEGMRFPDVIIELLSDTTREVDKGGKKELYEQLFRTPEYYLYDPFHQECIGYYLHGGYYQGVQPDAEQKIFSAVAGLYLGVRDGWLRWLTADGVVVSTPLEWAEQERQRATQAVQQAEQARHRVAQAEQLLAAYQHRFGNLDAPG